MKPVLLYTATVFVLLFACSGKPEPVTADLPRSTIRAIHVRNSGELKNALAAATAGDSVILADGIYEGRFEITASGKPDAPIVLTGSRNAVLDGGSTEQGYGLYIRAAYCRVRGVTIRNSLKGIVADETTNSLIEGVLVTKVGEEGIHLRKFSSRNEIRNSTITHTGLKPERAGYGEGIYIGSAHNNWEKYSGGKPDRCDQNNIIQNTIGPFVTAECIDIKEGTTGGWIEGNRFYSEGISGANSADSWMDVKGNNYRIENNKGDNPGGSLLLDGYQVNCAYEGWGNNNVFRKNHSIVNAPGYVIHVRLKSSKGIVTGTVVTEDNTAEGAGKGRTNINTTL
ncbi:right-handed parallel beta-helix repeat-containing protein [Niabella beijingensis]|uniref:right-handed parallel beta-helix repeat-containing protein n=1 Tax=Niabella beijingensis TaxID=2872700 RepID=UPI001CBDE81C|nr:right-handed parallel beta-helix repeat-containing protein [Niabella beijingensis]MBZ4188730.1 right-handed parallel beta-helix repeat-containing protein [Niabella beijingensis]